MANNVQLIADLGEAINLSNAAQVRFGANNDSFNRTINAGLAQINATIRDIDGLLGQILDKINELKARIAELQGNGGPGNAQEIALLKQQLVDAQNGQVAATEVMNRALVTLRSNTEAMDGAIAKQDEPAMTAQLKTVNDSLQAMQKRLQDILNDNQGLQPPGKAPRAGPQKPKKPAKREQLPGEEVPPGDQGAAGDNAIENDQEFENELARIDGGSRRRRRKNKTSKKTRRKTKTTKKKRKQKGGYGYKTKQRKSQDDSDTASSQGRGRGIYKKSKKRRSTRS
jgi:hypothetical protein